MNLLSSLVSHSFHQICSKYLFATIELHDANHKSSKKRFIKPLERRPDVINYICKLTYNMDERNNDHLLSPNFPKLLWTISCPNCLAITASKLDWNTLDPSVTSALLYLMRLPTINHIDLSFIQNFPLASVQPPPICQPASARFIQFVPSQPSWRGSLWNCSPVGDDAQNSWIPYFRIRHADNHLEVVTS